MTPLEILYADAHYVAVYKPAGLVVHRSERAPDREVAMSLLRDQLGRRVWPVHRLDRPTAGVLVFALSSADSAALSRQFESRLVSKVYRAVVRGWCPEEGVVDHPLTSARDGVPKAAVTRFRRLATTELPMAVGGFPSARYALVEVKPETGRYHQIRKHFHHLSHHLIGDTAHGDGRHNRAFREHLDWHRLCLLAGEVGFEHPFTGEAVHIYTEGDEAWLGLIERLFPAQK